MVGLFPQRQGTYAAAIKSSSTAAAGQRQQYYHQHHQAEPSPTRSDHSADNAAGVGDGWLGALGLPPHLKDPPSLASAIADSSPRSVIQDSNNFYLRRRIFDSTPKNSTGHHNDYADEDRWREAADIAAEEDEAIQKTSESSAAAAAAAAATILDTSLDISLVSSSSMSRSIFRSQATATTTSPSSPIRGLGGATSFDGQVIARRVSWEEEVYESSPTYLPKNLHLEARLSKLEQGQQRSSGRVIGRAHSFDSASANSKSCMNHSSTSSVANSIQPSVESACVRQNAELFQMMEGDMMDLFVPPATVKAGESYEQSIVFGNDDDGFHNVWAGQDVRPAQSSSTPPGLGFSVVRGLKPLAEEEEGGFLLDEKDESDLNYHGDGNGGEIHKEGDKYISLYPTRVAETGMQPQQHHQWHVIPPQSNEYEHIIPSLSQEYDDPSLFWNNSLISDGSSQISDCRPPVALRSELSMPQPQAQRSTASARIETTSRMTATPPPNNLGGLLIAGKKKDLANFFDKVSKNIFSGCDDYNSESSDIFYVNDSQFGREEEDLLSEQSQSNIGPSNWAIPFSGNKSGEEKEDRNESFETFCLQPQHTNPNIFSSANVNTTDAHSKTIPNLPPASTFLSAKQRARMRKYDTTPLRTNTSRARTTMTRANSYGNASVGNANMISIKEGLLEESEEDLMEEGYEESCTDDKKGADDNEVNRAQSRDDIDSPDRSTHFCVSVNRNDQTPEQSFNRASDVAAGLDVDTDFDNNDIGTVKTTSREKSEGHSLAWHSNNGVNDDEQYDSKRPPSRADRAARLASRLSLATMSTHTAMLQQHFVDDHEQLRDGSSSFYHPSYRSDTADGSLGLIQEESCEDNAVSACSIGGDRDSLGEDEHSLCYTHDDFVRDFKTIKERGDGFLSQARKTNVVEVEALEIKLPTMDKITLDTGAHDDSDTSHRFARQNYRQQRGHGPTPSREMNSRLESASRLSKKNDGSNVMHLLATTRGQRNGLYNKEHAGVSTRIQARHHSKIPGHHPHHVPNEVSKSQLEEKLRGLPGVTGNAAKRDRGDNSVGTSELGSLFSDRSHFVSPVPTMIFHRTYPDSSTRSSVSSTQDTYNASSNYAKFNQGNRTSTSNQHTPFDGDCYGTIAYELSELLSDFLPVGNEQRVLQNHHSLPNPAIVSIEEAEKKSVKTLPPQMATNTPPSQKKDTGNVVLRRVNSKVLADSVVKIEGDICSLQSNSWNRRLLRDNTSESKNLLLDAVSSSRDSTFRSTSSTAANQDVNSRCNAFGSIAVQEVRNADSSRQQVRAVTANKHSLGAFELEIRNAKYGVENPTSSNAEAAPSRSDKAPLSSKEESQKVSLQSETVINARALEMQPVAEKTIGTNDIVMQHERVQVSKKQPKSNATSITTAEAAHSIHFSHHNSTVENGSFFSSQSSADATSVSVRRPQIPTSINKSCNAAPNVTDDASQQSSMFEAFEVAPLKTFANIGEISTPDGDSHVSLNDLGVHHAYVKRTRSYLDQQAQASSYGVTSLSAPVGIPRSSAVVARSARDAIHQHDVGREQSPSLENSKSLKYELPSVAKSDNSGIPSRPSLVAGTSNSSKLGGTGSRRQPHAGEQSSSQENPKSLKYEPPVTASTTNSSKLSRTGSRPQPQVNGAGSNRTDVIKQKMRMGWRKLVMGGVPAVETSSSPAKKGAPPQIAVNPFNVNGDIPKGNTEKKKQIYRRESPRVGNDLR